MRLKKGLIKAYLDLVLGFGWYRKGVLEGSGDLVSRL